MAITSRPPTQAEKDLFRSVDPSRLPESSVTITPSGPSQDSGYTPGGGGSSGGGSRSRRSRPEPPKPVYESNVLKQSFTSKEAREKAEKQYFQQQRQSTVQTTKPTEQAVFGPSTIQDVKKEDIYTEPFSSRIRSSRIGQRVSGWGTGLSRVGQNIFEIRGGTTKVVKKAEVTPTSAYYGLVYSDPKVGGRAEPIVTPEDIKRGEGGTISNYEIVDYGDLSEEKLSASRKGAEILVERDKDKLTQDLLDIKNKNVQQEQERLEDLSERKTKQFEKKWEDKIKGGQFVGSEKEYEQYQREARQIQNILEVESRKSQQRVERKIDTTASQLIEQFEKKSGERISKGKITQALGRAPLYFGAGVATAGIVGGAGLGATAASVLKTAGVVGLGATAITGYSKGLEGDYTSVATMGIKTGAFLAGGLTYGGIKAGNIGYSKAQISRLQKGIDVGRGITIDRTATGIRVMKPARIRTLGGKKTISLQRDFKFRVDPKKPYALQDTGVGTETYRIRNIFGDPKTITKDFRFSFKPQKVTGSVSGEQIKGISTRTWTQYGDDVKVFEGRGFGYKLRTTQTGDDVIAGARYSSYKYKPVIKDTVVSLKTGGTDIYGNIKLQKGYIDRFSSIIKMRKVTTPKDTSIRFIRPSKVKPTSFKDSPKIDSGVGQSLKQVQQYKPVTKPISDIKLKIGAGITTGVKPAPLRSLFTSVKPITTTTQTASLTTGVRSRVATDSQTRQRTRLITYQQPKFDIGLDVRQAQSFKPIQSSKTRSITTPSTTTEIIQPIQTPRYSTPKTPTGIKFRLPKRKDDFTYTKKGKVFKPKGITKKYQASVGAIALDYGITQEQYKKYRGKQFTGLEIRPFILPNKNKK